MLLVVNWSRLCGITTILNLIQLLTASFVKSLMTTASFVEKKLNGRNSTNAKTHLRSIHKEVFTDFLTKEDEQNRLKMKISTETKASSFATNSSAGSSQLMITSMLGNRNSGNSYLPKSAEALKRDQAVLNFVVQCGLPVNTNGSDGFKHLCITLDPKYNPPSNQKLDTLFQTRYVEASTKLHESLKLSRMVSLGMDIWTKKGYTSKYLAVTASFFDNKNHKPCHAMLNLFTIDHPHTGQMISEKVKECLKNWGIDQKKGIPNNNG